MANTDYSQTLGVLGVKSASALLTALEKRGVYVVADAEAPTALTPGNVTMIAFNGRLFHYDATDATTAHDGVTCIVTADGKRFKADGFGGAQARIVPVQSRTLTVPPGSPTLGQSWIVAAGATGAWAGKDTYIASFTARQWVFTVPNPYDLAVVIAENAVYQYSGTWAPFSLIPIAPNTISVAALRYNKFGLRVFNQTTNAPPGSPADGDAYIVNATPTGAWAGQTLKVAIYEISAWVFYTPYAGASVYDVSLKAFTTFDGTLWAASISGYSAVARTAKAGNTTISGNYVFDSATAPTVSNTTALQSISYACRKAAALLEVEIEVDAVDMIVVNGGSSAVAWGGGYCYVPFGIWIDGASAAADWEAGSNIANLALNLAGFQTLHCPQGHTFTFHIQAPNDTAAHTYAMRAGQNAASVSGPAINSVKGIGARIKIRELN